MEELDNFYVYIYLDPRKHGLFEYGSYEFNYEPFYVGKGKDDRINDKKNDHCEYKINKIKRLGFEPIRRRIIENLEENYSFELEKELIKLVGREDLKEGPLTNLVDGGEGVSGYKHTEEQLQKRRKEYYIIKNTFERRDCKLLTEEKDYKNKYTKLEYIHNKCGKKYSIRWNNFQQGQGCPHCGTEECAKKQKKEYSFIKNSFEREEYQLITEEKDYKNNETKLEYIHKKCGNKNSITWGSFQQGRGCPICGIEEQAKKQRKEYSFIKNSFEREEYQLITEEKDYKNAFQKLEYIHNKCGNKHSIIWNAFQRGHGCSVCGREEQAKKRRKSFPEIKNSFENIRGCKLKTKEKDYKNSETKLEYICSNGHEHSISWNNFQQRKNNYCPKCNRINKEKRKGEMNEKNCYN